MDNNAIAQQLFEFLNNYNLIQSNLSEQENLNLIAAVLDQLNENENILTGFVSRINGINNPEKAVLLTDSKQLILSPNPGQASPVLSTDSIKSIELEESPSYNKIIINTESGPLEIYADNETGIEAINDALYSALSEIKPVSEVNRIFNLEPDTVIQEVVVETEPSNPEPVETPETFQSVDTFEGSVYDSLPIDDLPLDYSETIIPESDQASLKKNETDQNYFNIFNHKVKKSTAFIVGGIGILVIAALIFFIASNLSGTGKANKEAKQLVEIFNEIDEIYFTAVDYEQNPEGITADDWQDLDNTAIDIQNSLNEFSTTELSDALYQAIYFYNDSLMTALYYGQSYATTGNELQKNTLKQRLDSAYQNRLAVISILNSNFPDLLKSVKYGTTKDNSIEDLINETNSNGSDLLNQENSFSSDESRENSLTSDEIIDYSKYSNAE